MTQQRIARTPVVRKASRTGNAPAPLGITGVSTSPGVSWNS